MTLHGSILYILMFFASTCLTSLSTTINAMSGGSATYSKSSDDTIEEPSNLVEVTEEISYIRISRYSGIKIKRIERVFDFGDFLIDREEIHTISAKKAPKLVYFNGYLYAFYPGKDEEIYYNKYRIDGDRFVLDVHAKEVEDYNHSGIRSDRSPGLAVYDDILYVVYKADDNDSMYYVTWDGVSEKFRNEQKFNGPETDDGPVLASFDDKLYLLHTGQGGDSMYEMSYHRDRGWSNEFVVNGWSDDGPAIGIIDSPSISTLSPILYFLSTNHDNIGMYVKDLSISGENSWISDWSQNQTTDDTPCTTFVGEKRYDAHVGGPPPKFIGGNRTDHTLYITTTEYRPIDLTSDGDKRESIYDFYNRAMPEAEKILPYPDFRSDDSCSLIHIKEYNSLVLAYFDDEIFHIHYSALN